MEWKKYAYTFLITAAIFATAILASNFLSQKKINELKNIESAISVDILSSETQFSLLSELSCRDIDSSFLSQEIATLGDKLVYTEQNRGADDKEVLNLKKYYSLLQIKDFLLSEKVKERCGSETLSIIYFYANLDGECDDCEKEGYVLTKLRQDYPELRVYSFDYDLDLSALKTLISIYNVEKNLPSLIINDKVYYGFKDVEAIKEIIPELKKMDLEKETAESESKATSTKAEQ
jgi:hypothetical protein